MISSVLLQTRQVVTIILSLQTSQFRPEEVRQFAQSHMAHE